MNFESYSPSFFRPKSFGIIDASGADAARFLHRMSTNSIEDLAVGASCFTAFVNQKARLIAVCYVSRQSETNLRLITPYEKADTLLQWLDGYLFVEDVTLSDISSQFILEWSLGESEFEIAGPDFLFTKGSVSSGFSLVQTETSTSKELDESEFESLRIAGLIPFSKNEINQAYHPIQLGLNDTIHWAKGCYIGQEVISRLESKDRAAKTLIGAKVSESDWSKLQIGEPVRCNGDVVGTLTSVAPIYFEGESNALAVLKRSPPSGGLQTDLSKVRIDS